jgi:hypothetical protein
MPARTELHDPLLLAFVGIATLVRAFPNLEKRYGDSELPSALLRADR